jgi:5-methylthioadenosine/S-adenosylhomocysteine deaminase
MHDQSGYPTMSGRPSLWIQNAVVDGETTSLLIRNGVIEALGPDAGPAPGEEVDRTLDGSGLHAFPGLRNGHTHAAMTLFRGWGDDMPLMEWLQTRIWPAEALLTPEDVYDGVRLACLEMIRSGTTYLNDLYWHHEAVARAIDEMGLRAHVGAAFLDFGDAEKGRAQQKMVLRHLDSRKELGARIRITLGPHAIYTVRPDSLAWLGEVSESEDLPLHIHLSETRGEVEDCLAAHGVRPAQFLEQLGLVTPRLLAAHGVYLDAEELALLADAGATVVTNPNANLKLATGGIFDYAGARRAGLRVVLGTDGPASNNDLDMIEEMKTVALIQKHRAEDATCLPAREALDLATENPAEVLGWGPGRIAEGAPADLILVDFSHPSTQPLHDPVSALVYAANGRAVHTTICDGRVLMHRWEVEGFDEEEIIARAGATARRVVERAEAAG